MDLNEWNTFSFISFTSFSFSYQSNATTYTFIRLVPSNTTTYTFIRLAPATWTYTHNDWQNIFFKLNNQFSWSTHPTWGHKTWLTHPPIHHGWVSRRSAWPTRLLWTKYVTDPTVHPEHKNNVTTLPSTLTHVKLLMLNSHTPLRMSSYLGYTPIHPFACQVT